MPEVTKEQRNKGVFLTLEDLQLIRSVLMDIDLSQPEMRVLIKVEDIIKIKERANARFVEKS